MPTVPALTHAGAASSAVGAGLVAGPVRVLGATTAAAWSRGPVSADDLATMRLDDDGATPRAGAVGGRSRA